MRVGVRGKRKVFGLGSLGKKGFLEEVKPEQTMKDVNEMICPFHFKSVNLKECERLKGTLKIHLED